MQITFEELRPLIEGQVIVSAQAPDGHALRDTHALTAIARACVDGGSPAIRCGGYGGVEDIASISNAVDVPVFGLTKEGTTGCVYHSHQGICARGSESWRCCCLRGCHVP